MERRVVNTALFAFADHPLPPDVLPPRARAVFRVVPTGIEGPTLAEPAYGHIKPRPKSGDGLVVEPVSFAFSDEAGYGGEATPWGSGVGQAGESSVDVDRYGDASWPDLALEFHAFTEAETGVVVGDDDGGVLLRSAAAPDWGGLAVVATRLGSQEAALVAARTLAKHSCPTLAPVLGAGTKGEIVFGVRDRASSASPADWPADEVRLPV